MLLKYINVGKICISRLTVNAPQVYDHLYSPDRKKHKNKYSNENNLNYWRTYCHTLNFNKPYQQHLQENSQNVSGGVQMAIRYERNICTVQ